jgi:hypothetical protein
LPFSLQALDGKTMAIQMPAPMPQELSLAVVGALFPNVDGSNRLFEIRMLDLGGHIALIVKPDNKNDPSAVAVYSFRGYQIGYLSAERCDWIRANIRQGTSVHAIFQHHVGDSVAIRVRLDGKQPTLPPLEIPAPPPAPLDPQESGCFESGPDSGFWSDYIPPAD